MQTHTHTKYIDLNKLYLEFFLYCISIKFYCINTTNYINYKKKPTATQSMYNWFYQKYTNLLKSNLNFGSFQFVIYILLLFMKGVRWVKFNVGFNFLICPKSPQAKYLLLFIYILWPFRLSILNIYFIIHKYVGIDYFQLRIKQRNTVRV